ncbi:MAG: fibronectin type III domain-containing protein [Pelagimonas sp.]|nr:fibronectin type III domain-containing protein [Pelagimonas sp.]
MIAVDAPEVGLVGTYRVSAPRLHMEKGALKAVRLTLSRIDPGAFVLGLDEQGTVQDLPEPDVSAGVPLPQNVTASAAGIQSAANAWSAGIGVGWQAPPSDALSPRLRYSPAGSESWQDVSIGAGATSAKIPGLIDGQGYDVSLSFVTPGGVVGDDVRVLDVTAAAVSEPPAAPSNLAVSDAGGGVALVELTASASAGLWKTEIYRDAVLVGVVFAAPESEISFVDNSGAGTFDWTARSVNVSNISSTSDAGPVTAIIT